MNREQFSIQWQGSLIAPETGWYEFRIRTRNGVRLYLNTDLAEGDSNRRDDSAAKRETATIDGWVTTVRTFGTSPRASSCSAAALTR
jgi:hypothetical protein